MATVTKRRSKSSKMASKSAKGTAKNDAAKNGAAAKAGKAAGKAIYYFSKSKTDGRGDMKPLLGGKGREPGRDDEHRPAGAAGVHHHHRSLHVLLQERQKISAHVLERRENVGRLAGKRDGQEIQRYEKSALGFGPLRSARFDARHDGHDFEFGPERQNRRSLESRHGQRPLCVGFLSPVCADVRRRGDGRAEAPRERARAVR